jgi:RNA polymerase sigma factor (sigma-70 family)
VSAVPSIGVEVGVAPEADLTRALYERHAGQIYRFCFHQLGTREEAEDAVQSTFLNAFRGIKGGVVPESESAWLFKIAHNVCLTRRRSSWRRDRVESPTDFEVVEELAPAAPRRADELIGLQDVLERMPEHQRRAILLREWQGLSYREIGQELRLSQAAVETLIFRARRTLAEGLEGPAVQRRRRRLASGALGSLVTAAQAFLGGGAAVKVAAVVAAAGAGGVLATAPVHDRHAPPRLTVSQKPAVARVRRKAAPAPVLPSAMPPPTMPAAPPRQHPAVRHVVAPAAPTHVAPGQAKKQLPAPAAPVVRPKHDPPGQAKKAVAAPPAAPKVHGRSTAPGRLKKEAAPPAAHDNGKANGHGK